MENGFTTLFFKLIDRLLDGFKSYQLWLIIFTFRLSFFFIPNRILLEYKFQDIQKNLVLNIFFILSCCVLLILFIIYIIRKISLICNLRRFFKSASQDEAKMIFEYIESNEKTIKFPVVDGIAESLMKQGILEVNVKWITSGSQRAYTMTNKAWNYFSNRKRYECLKNVSKKRR